MKFIEETEKIKAAGNFRTIPDVSYKSGKYIMLDGKKLLNFASNDYLNIASNEFLRNEFVEKYKKSKEFFFSSASSRLLSGSSKVYKNLENLIANMYEGKAALLFNSGYQCNFGTITALFGANDVIFSDKLNHASINAALKSSGAAFYRYKHLDYAHLESFLAKHRNKFKNALIVSESLFSMDGDIADINRLIELKLKYNAFLMIDEAHAFAVFGQNLGGIGEDRGEIDIRTLTFGKALGSEGAMCVASEEIINYLVNKSSPFIFSTAIAPVNVLWTYFLLFEKKDFMKKQKEKLLKLVEASKQNSQIVPYFIGESEKTLEIATKLKNFGYFISAVRPPTVPKDSARLRISLTSDIEIEEYEALLAKIEELK